MRRPRSLRTRLALVALASTGAWVLALTVLFNVLLDEQLDREADDVLRTRAAAVASTVRVDPRGHVSVREPANDDALDAGVWVFDGDTPVERPRATPAAAAAAHQLAADREPGPRFRDIGEDPAVRLFARPVTHDGKRVGAIVVETSLGPYERTSELALVGSVLVGLLVAAGAYAATREVVRRALTPVAEMADQAATWSAHDVGRRFGDTPRPDELRELAANLDSVLDRIGAVLRHEQQLASEISHELRTPLAVVAAETDLLRSGPRPADEHERGLQAIADTTARMTTLLDDLLAQATLVATEAPGRCRVAPVVAESIDQLVAGLARADVRTEVDVPDRLEAGVTAEVLGRVLTPVLSNAGRYARSVVSVSARRDGAAVVVQVSDDGPGVPTGFRETVFEPGRRADPADGHPGAGLGLALARRLVRAAGGEITLAGDAGSVFLVTLPPA